MNNLALKLRIGEKIALGMGLVSVLFLAVIWQYHSTLEKSLNNYQTLLDVNAANKFHALNIERHIQSARIHEKSFVLQRDKNDARQVEARIDKVLQETSALRAVEADNAAAAKTIAELTNAYQLAFAALAEAWTTKGLDHNSGLQGDFRNRVHELEAMAAGFATSNIYLNLLQIRRAEKDLGLRRDHIYTGKIDQLILQFKLAITQSSLADNTKATLIDQIDRYAQAVADYAETVLANGDIQGGKGPFRDIAHLIEAEINQHYVPKLEELVLQLRRREKDYLLRLDLKYVEMVDQLIQQISIRVARSGLQIQDKNHFTRLLRGYQQDFHALVKQNQHIRVLENNMTEAVAGISGEVRQTVNAATLSMARSAAEIRNLSLKKEKQMLTMALIAVIIGGVFTWVLSRNLSRPLRRMAALLDRLAFAESTERMPHSASGRDEVNAMAGSVNTIAEHRQQFIQWWQTSMQEVEAQEALLALIEKSEAKQSAPAAHKVDISEQKLTHFLKALESSSGAKHDLRVSQIREIRVLIEECLAQLDPLIGKKRTVSGAEAYKVQTLCKEIHSRLMMIEH